jgi:hypothetical protein
MRAVGKTEMNASIMRVLPFYSPSIHLDGSNALGTNMTIV